jgi:light-regulated signal transduction histidine kinase (bacteriophytochrome)
VELVREAVAQGCDAAIVMLTGHGSRELELKALEAGAEIFLEKTRMDPTLLERSIRLAIERHRLRRALADRTKELERSNAELEQFAYVASHDLREPLRMIAGYTGLLQRKSAGSADEECEKFMGYVLEGVGRMHALIDDLLAFSRVGTAPRQLAVISARSALDCALEHLGPAIDDAGATIRSHDLPDVWGDAGQLSQLFQNLVGNALKFRNSRPPEVEVGARAEGAVWRFWVRDNGIGMDPKHAERIFVIFQRLHRKEYPGTGIGLAICKRIVERHGGAIWVESEPGNGATFFFTVPQTAGLDGA